MATVTKIFTFTSDEEGWIGTAGANLTVGHVTGEIFAELAVGAFDETGTWEYSAKYEDLGLPKEANITNVAVSVDFFQTSANRALAYSTSVLLDSNTLIAVDRSTDINTTTTFTRSGSALVSKTTDDDISIEIPIRLETTSGNPAGNRFVYVSIREVRVIVTYEHTKINAWDGNSWIEGLLWIWGGQYWKPAVVKKWNGSEWESQT